MDISAHDISALLLSGFGETANMVPENREVKLLTYLPGNRGMGAQVIINLRTFYGVPLVQSLKVF